MRQYPSASTLVLWTPTKIASPCSRPTDVCRPADDTERNLTVAQLFNLLKPTGHVMHQQFNIQQLYTFCPRCIYVFCIYLRTNSDLCHLQHKLIGFYNQDEKCLLRGTNWVFK